MSDLSTNHVKTRGFCLSKRPRQQRLSMRPQAERPPFPTVENECEHDSLVADHAQVEKLEKLLKRVSHLRLVLQFEANLGGYSANDRLARDLHIVQEEWYKSLDLAMQQAERALLGMIETEKQYGGFCHA